MTKLIAAAACAFVLLVWSAWPAAQTASGEQVYRQRCAGCHDLVSPRIPLRAALQKMPASRILRALDFGVMMNVAYPLRRRRHSALTVESRWTCGRKSRGMAGARPMRTRDFSRSRLPV